MGTDKYLLALSKNSLTVDALNEKIGQSAEISDDGTISDYVSPEPPPGELEPQPTADRVIRNVAIGTGVILVCVTVSVVKVLT